MRNTTVPQNEGRVAERLYQLFFLFLMVSDYAGFEKEWENHI